MGRSPAGAGRPRYIFGDLAACAVAGCAVAALTGVAIPTSWPGWAAMPLGMLMGMLLALPFWVAASTFLGMLEPMLQIMLAGMLAGMAATMEFGTALERAVLGGACGCAASLGLALLDWTLARRDGAWP